MQVVHYINQFFGGLGGEEKAGLPLEVRQGPVGPGRVLEQVLGSGSKVVTTLICGDNHAAENLEKITAEVIEKVKAAKADLFVAGPCFDAGRYGIACGALCQAVTEKLGIPAVSGMAGENPGVDLYKSNVYIVDSGQNVAQMQAILTKMVTLGTKLVNKEKIGRPADEGYHARGFLHSEFVSKSAGERLVDMLIAKKTGKPYQSEIPVRPFDTIPLPPAVKDLKKMRLAFATDGGIVPPGNPDKQPRGFSKVWGAYSFKGMDTLKAGEWDCAHGGMDNRAILADPNRLIPVDVTREMEKQGIIGKLDEEIYSTVGNGNPLDNSRRMGREMVKRMKANGVNAVILTSTWGTSTRSGAALVTEMERAGIPVVQVTPVTPVAKAVGANRVIKARAIIHPLGDPELPPAEEKELRRQLMMEAIKALQTDDRVG